MTISSIIIIIIYMLQVYCTNRRVYPWHQDLLVTSILTLRFHLSGSIFRREKSRKVLSYFFRSIFTLKWTVVEENCRKLPKMRFPGIKFSNSGPKAICRRILNKFIPSADRRSRYEREDDGRRLAIPTKVSVVGGAHYHLAREIHTTQHT